MKQLLSQQLQAVLLKRSACLAIVAASGERLTYRQFADEIANQLRILNAEGLEPGDVFAWLGLNCPRQLALLFAAEQLSLTLLPLNWRMPAQELQALVDESGSRLVFSDEKFADVGKQLVPNAVRKNRPDWEKTAILMVYTSGSTGRPQAALHGSAQLMANAQASWAAHQMRESDCILSALPLFHVGGLCIQTLPALLLGAKVVLQDRFESQQWLRLVEQHRVDLSVVVPPVMQSLLAEPSFKDSDLRSIRLLMAGSSIVPLPLIQTFHRHGVSVGQVYGATETGPLSVVLGADHARTKEGSCGWPAQGVELQLRSLNSEAPSEVLAPHQPGEVFLRAPNLMLGYQGSAPLGPEDYFSTGDLGVLSEDGSLTILGRTRELIISGGENIHPVEVEQQLAQMPGVEEVAVIGVPDVRWGQVPLAVLVLDLRQVNPVETDVAQAVYEFLRPRLASFKIPRRVRLLSALPKTALGKVQRASLTKLVESLGLDPNKKVD